MALTNIGLEAIASRLINDTTVTEYDNANATTCVGDSNLAFAAEQTDMQAAVNKFRKGMDATYPVVTGNVITFQSTFTGTEANFSWQEWGISNHPSAGELLNRVVENNGTKVAGQTWIMQTDITIHIGI